MLRATAATLTSLLESRGDVSELYLKAATQQDETTLIEKVSHTHEAMEHGSEVVRVYPVDGFASLAAPETVQAA